MQRASVAIESPAYGSTLLKMIAQGHMDTDAQTADVIAALRSLEAQINEIMERIGERRTISPSEKAELQAKLATLKADIKAAAKLNKVHDDRLPQTETERHYFEPALRGAVANFRVATNSHPITSNWHGCLYDVRIDINYFLYQLEKQHPVG